MSKRRNTFLFVVFRRRAFFSKKKARRKRQKKKKKMRVESAPSLQALNDLAERKSLDVRTSLEQKGGGLEVYVAIRK